jgi:SAM-dependent methyltransferase
VDGREIAARPSWYLDPLVARQKRRVHQEWIRRRLATHTPDVVLKTDLFEEAYGEDRIFDDLLPAARLAVGMDVNRATAHAAVRRGGSAFVSMVCDARAMPLATHSADTIISTSTLDHFHGREALDRALDELTRILCPGGVLLITLDNARNPLYHLLRWGSRRGWTPFELGYTAPRRELTRALRDRGLQVRSEEYLLHNPRGISTLLFIGLRAVLGRFAARPIATLLRVFSWLGRLPTRSITGCFLAVSAVKGSCLAEPLEMDRRPPT